jgi:hypothetical protein
MAAPHHLTYKQSTSNDGTDGLFATCSCGEFQGWIQGTDLETEVDLLALHDVHLKIEDL